MITKLLQNFYTEVSSTFSIANKNNFQTEVKLNPSHPVYKGHFEQVPVAPGVCLVQMLKEVLSDKLQQDLLLVAGDNIKFLNLINPTEKTDFTIHYLIQESDEHLLVTASLNHKETVYLKFKGKFQVRKG